jgi:hypothetical protein
MYLRKEAKKNHENISKGRRCFGCDFNIEPPEMETVLTAAPRRLTHFFKAKW